MDESYTNVYQAARLAKGYTQERAALLTGVSVDSIKAYESGRTKPKFETVRRMAMVYDAQYLLAEYFNQNEPMQEIFRFGKIEANKPLINAGMETVKDIKDISQFADRLFEITYDDKISAEEEEDLKKICGMLTKIVRDSLNLSFAKKQKK